MSYSQPVPLTAGAAIDRFDCGEPDLNDWLAKYALGNERSGASRCFVTSRDGLVVGYYALATGSVLQVDATPRIGHGMPEPIPVVLLGRLAVDLKEQGKGLGSDLLRDSITRTVAAADIIGVRAMLVHALNVPAREFYLHYGFERSPTDDDHLMLLLKDARRVARGG